MPSWPSGRPAWAGCRACANLWRTWALAFRMRAGVHGRVRASRTRAGARGRARCSRMRAGVHGRARGSRMRAGVHGSARCSRTWAGARGKHEMSPLLSLEGVGKSYLRGPHRVRVLKDVTLAVGAGQLVAVWGKRGVGKTTLLKIAARLERPDQGVVRFEGIDMAGLREAEHTRLMLERIGWGRRAGPRSGL